MFGWTLTFDQRWSWIQPSVYRAKCRLNNKSRLKKKCREIVKSYCRKTFFAKKRLFLEFLLSRGQTVDFRYNLRTCLRKNGKRAIECAFPQRCSSSGSRVVCLLVVVLKSTKFDLYWPLVTWPLTWPKKWLNQFLHDFFTLFRMPFTACRYMAHEPS